MDNLNKEIDLQQKLITKISQQRSILEIELFAQKQRKQLDVEIKELEEERKKLRILTGTT